MIVDLILTVSQFTPVAMNTSPTPASGPQAGYTLIELLEAIAAIALGVWSANTLSGHCEGVWRAIVFWTVATVGSGIIFVLFLYGFGTLFGYLRRHGKNQSETDTPKRH